MNLKMNLKIKEKHILLIRFPNGNVERELVNANLVIVVVNTVGVEKQAHIVQLKRVVNPNSVFVIKRLPMNLIMKMVTKLVTSPMMNLMMKKIQRIIKKRLPNGNVVKEMVNVQKVIVAANTVNVEKEVNTVVRRKDVKPNLVSVGK